MAFERIRKEIVLTNKFIAYERIEQNEKQSITGGYFPPSEEQLEKLNPIERIIICW